MEQIGKYKVIRELGAGGFGAVYLAEDMTLHEQVAVKVFDVKDENMARLATSATGDASEVLKSRFLNEAKTLRRLSDNPNIVDVYEFGELANGQPYYVMPYLPDSLKGQLGSDATNPSVIADLPANEKPRPLPLATAIDYLEQLLFALTSVHQAGLVHRDIKPANLLISNNRTIRLCDFGIAKVPDADHSHSGVGMGSRNYMAPEQRQSAKHVDARSDIYSVGVLAYRMVTGTLPEGRFVDPNRLQPGLSASLNNWILTALEQSPDNRFSDAGVMLKALKDANMDGENNNEASEQETGTWINEGVPGIKSELKPLETKISQLLTEQGEVTETDQITLQALGDIAGLDEDALSALIKTIEEKLRHQTGPLSNWLKSIARHQDKTRLDRITENALRVAGRSIGLTESQITAHIQRKLPDTLMPEPQPDSSQSGYSLSGNFQSDSSRSVVNSTAEVIKRDGSQTYGTVTETAIQQDVNLVRQVQTRLNRLGYKVNENGQLDTRTQMEIKAFERDNELRETGDIDSILTDKLEQALCAQDDNAWQQTQTLNTVEAYADYQKDNPQGQYFADADDNAWQQVSEQATSKLEPETLNEYQQHFPDGKHIGEIEPLTNEINGQKEDKLWNKARNSLKIKPYEVYLAKYPDGRHKEQALKGLEKACYTEQSPTEYLENYPDGQYVAKANEEIAQLQAKKVRIRKRIKKNMVVAGAISSVLATGYVGYEYSQQDDRAWHAAQKENTMASYRRFIKQYGDSEYTKKAMQALVWFAEKAWQAAQHENTIEAYQSFIKQYSDSDYGNEAKQAQVKLIDNAWQVAQQDNSITAYQRFIKQYKDGEYSARASLLTTQLIEAANIAIAEAKKSDLDAWMLAKAENSVASYERYLANYSKGLYAEQVQSNLKIARALKAKVASEIKEKNAWQLAKAENSVASYERYLANYSRGVYFVQAQTNLKEAKALKARAAAEKKDTNAWQLASMKNTVASYLGYLDQYSQGIYASQALTELKKARSQKQEAMRAEYLTYVNSQSRSRKRDSDNCTERNSFAIGYVAMDSSDFDREYLADIPWLLWEGVRKGVAQLESEEKQCILHQPFKWYSRSQKNNPMLLWPASDDSHAVTSAAIYNFYEQYEEMQELFLLDALADPLNNKIDILVYWERPYSGDMAEVQSGSEMELIYYIFDKANSTAMPNYINVSVPILNQMEVVERISASIFEQISDVRKKIDQGKGE